MTTHHEGEEPVETHPSTTREAVEQLNATDLVAGVEAVIDPETGEVLAENEEDRQFLIGTYAADLVAAAEWQLRATTARRGLALLMRVGDAHAVKPGWAVACKPGAPGRRTVIPHALDEHAEALAPLGLAPREVPKVVTEYAKVSDLTSKAAREALARIGLTPEAFLDVGLPGEPSIVVVAPEGSG